MPMATIHKMGQGDLYHIHFLDQRTDPGFGVGEGSRPDQGLPGSGNRPDQGLPGGGASNKPGTPGIPDHELPDTPPPQLAPGWTLVLIRPGQTGKWQYAAIAPGSPPPRPLPPSAGHPDQGLPQPPQVNPMPPQGPGMQPPTVGGGPAPQPPMHPSGQPVPPQVTPQR